MITRGKAELIVRLTHYLSDEEAKAVEAEILGRAGRLTPGGLRSALARAVHGGRPEDGAGAAADGGAGSRGWSGGPRTPATPR